MLNSQILVHRILGSRSNIHKETSLSTPGGRQTVLRDHLRLSPTPLQRKSAEYHSFPQSHLIGHPDFLSLVRGIRTQQLHLCLENPSQQFLILTLIEPILSKFFVWCRMFPLRSSFICFGVAACNAESAVAELLLCSCSHRLDLNS